ncbi:MAG: hypothetical protein II077_11560, partial [Treponema sp.]|nr:hypothetical protein [Treponema sp.]
GIMCHVGIDVGTNTTAPKILMERLGKSLNDAAFATSLYFIFRTIGCLTGSFFPTSSNKYGHVAILVAVYNTKYFIVFEQDGFKQDGARLAFRSREGLLGCLWRKGGY